MRKTTVLIVDDHPVIPAGLARVLNAEPDLEVVGCASDGVQALRQLEDVTPDIVIMDIYLPGADGIAVTEEIRRRRLGTRVLMFTAARDPELLLAAITAGVRGYVHKECGVDDVIHSIRALMRGEAVIPASMSHYVLEQLSGLSRELNQLRQGEARNELSHREFEVAALVAEGHTNQEIAHELSISILTAKNHVHNILSKLEASSRREIAVRFRRSGILRSGSGKSN